MPAAASDIWTQLGLGEPSDSASTPAGVDPRELKWGELAPDTAIGEVKPLFPRIDKTKTMSEIKNQEQDAGAGGTGVEVQSPESKVQSPKSGGGVQTPNSKSQSEPGSGQHATEAGTAEVATAKPAQHATEADAVPGAVGVTSFIDITDFTKVDLRVGEVLTAERIPKADKLLLLSVDVGEEKPRQILAGIAQYYSPEQLVGRKIAVVANLKPRKLRGHESQGMLLAASVGEEGKPVIATFTEDVPNGARLK